MAELKIRSRTKPPNAAEFGELNAVIEIFDIGMARTTARLIADGVLQPPYYANIGYADRSDYFYVWLRKALGSVYPNLFSTLLTPKAQELVATPYRFNGDRHGVLGGQQRSIDIRPDLLDLADSTKCVSVMCDDITSSCIDSAKTSNRGPDS